MAKVNEKYAIDGAAALRRVFEELPQAVATRVARRLLYRAAVPMRDAARAKVPIRFGALKRSIIVRTGQELEQQGLGIRMGRDGTNVAYTKFARTGGVKAYVTIDPKYFRVVRTKSGLLRARALKRDENYSSPSELRIYPRRYAHLVEFGTMPHAIGRDSSVRKGLQKGRMHPGSAPQPFMRPAFDEHAERAMQIMAEEAGAEITKELARIQSGRKK